VKETKEEPSQLVHIRLPTKIFNAVEEAVDLNLHVTKSDLIRDAIRRYLEENFPQLSGRMDK